MYLHLFCILTNGKSHTGIRALPSLKSYRVRVCAAATGQWSRGKKKITEEFKIIKFKAGYEVSSVSTVSFTNRLRKAQRECEKERRGVISGISQGENLEELKEILKGGTIRGFKWLQALRNGEKVDSPSVLLELKDEFLPTKVMVGYMSFSVRAYVPPPFRCYECQRYGHTASVCKGKQRCGRCLWRMWE